MKKYSYIPAFLVIALAILACQFGGQPIGGSSSTDGPTSAPSSDNLDDFRMPTDVPSGSGSSNNQSGNTNGGGSCSFSTPSSNLDNMPKVRIEDAPYSTWFHPVYNEALFNAQNNWGGAFSWGWGTLAFGTNNGGTWKGENVDGVLVYRAYQNSVNWCLGIKTTEQYKSQALGNKANLDMSINVRIKPNTTVYVRTTNGSIVSGETSDLGDIQIVLPDEGVVYIWTEFTTAATTGESRLWFGPRDRTLDINTIFGD